MPSLPASPPNKYRDRGIGSFALRLRELVPRLGREQCELFAEVAWPSLRELQPADAAEVFVRAGLTGETGL